MNEADSLVFTVPASTLVAVQMRVSLIFPFSPQRS